MQSNFYLNNCIFLVDVGYSTCWKEYEVNFIISLGIFVRLLIGSRRQGICFCVCACIFVLCGK